MTELPALNRRNSEKKRPLGLNDRISLKIKAKMNNMDDMNPATDGQHKGTFQDLDDKYNRQRKRRTEIQNGEYASNGTLKMTPPSSSEDSLESATINNIQRKVELLFETDQTIRDYITKNNLNAECLLSQVRQPFFMLHLLQGLRNQQKLNSLIYKKIKSINALQKSKNNYQNSENRMQKLLRNRMKYLQKHIE